MMAQIPNIKVRVAPRAKEDLIKIDRYTQQTCEAGIFVLTTLRNI